MAGAEALSSLVAAFWPPEAVEDAAAISEQSSEMGRCRDRQAGDGIALLGIQSAFCHRAISMNGCGKDGESDAGPASKLMGNAPAKPTFISIEETCPLRAPSLPVFELGEGEEPPEENCL